MTRHFLRDDDLSPQEQAEVLTLARQLKNDRHGHRPLAGPRTVAVLFDKPSTRTRVSFCTGIAELGGFPLVIDAAGSQLCRGEPPSDTVRVLERQCAAIVWRTFGQDSLDELAVHSTVPVINGLSDMFHPCQALADLFTVTEHFSDVAGRTFTFFGDTSCNMAHSYALSMVGAGMHVRLCGPARSKPLPHVAAAADAIAARTGGSLTCGSDPRAAAVGSDILATDTWFSMGGAPVTAERLAEFAPYQLNAALLELATPEAVALHCLPAHRGEEISAQVLDGPRALAWNQAENRLHVQKALLSWLLEQ